MGKELVGQRFALGAKLSRARQYRYSASKPLSYWQKRHVSHQGGPQNRARRSTPYREIQARDYRLNSIAVGMPITGHPPHRSRRA